jgi:chemotaxis protein histidine kinase CheA/ActR/RegA family two-component response regulator
LSTDDHGSLVQIFLAEASHGLTRLWTALHPSDSGHPDRHAVRAEYIAAHTLRGSASLYGFATVAELAERLEAQLENIEDLSEEGWIERVTLLCELVEALRRQIEAIERSGMEDATALEGSSSPRVSPEPSKTPERASAEEAPTDQYLLPEMESEVYSYFAPEAQEYLDAMEAGLLRLEKSPNDPETIQELFRTAHTLKGSAYTVGFQAVGDLTHHLEDFLGAIREGRGTMTPELADAIFRVVDVVRLLMRRDPRNLDQAREQFVSVRSQLRRIGLETSPVSDAFSETGEATLEPIPDAAIAELEETGKQRTEQPEGREPAGGAAPKPGDEAAVIRVSRERLERLLNLVGELVISRGRLEQRLLALEQLSHQVLIYKNRMLDSVRGFEEKHSFTFTPAPGTDDGRAAALLGDFGGLEFDKYDDFNILARQITEVSTDVGESMSQLNGSIRKAREDMSQLQRLTLGMRDEIARARMVPVGTPFMRFRRAVREMAKASGKEVSLSMSGEGTEVDTVLVERLVDPLIHLVRNAVFHGIESPSVRLTRGKPTTGTLYLHAAHRGNAVVIEVEDDGGGLDLERIKAKAVALGLVRSELVSTLTDTETAKLIFLPGFSTAEGVGDQAGRGIGLDVVKRAVEGMNGQIDVESEAGVGTKFTLTLPLTLLISMALLVRVGTERYAFPLPSIREVVLPKAGAIQEVGGRPMLQIGDEAVEVRPLARLLGMESATPTLPQPVVIIRTATGVFGLAVDELLGRQEIVIKGLGELKPLQESCFGGATIDPEGRVVLVLDVSRLLGGGRRAAIAPRVAPALLPEPPTEAVDNGESSDVSRILLIDDSLSVRKFVGRMLERAGYMVDTAVDGEEGLRRAGGQDYKLIITDLEMPKLNGYEVIQALRDRSQTKTVPILVMTTRAGEKHRRMALSIGASAYIAKPVEERALVQEVERWIGRYTGVKSQ